VIFKLFEFPLKKKKKKVSKKKQNKKKKKKKKGSEGIIDFPCSYDF